MPNKETTTAEKCRAQTWDDYVGQPDLKRRLDIQIRSAMVGDGRDLEHILLVAPPGCGKTTLARLISSHSHDYYTEIVMPVKIKEFAEILEYEAVGGIVLLDELHNAPRAFQEMLQQALEKGSFTNPSNGKTVNTSRITFIGATTTAMRHAILEPLQDRFLNQPTWVPYTDEDLQSILTGMASRMGVTLSETLCADLARAAGGTPRTAQKMVTAVRDLTLIDETVTVDAVLDLAGFDRDGLTPQHLEYLRLMSEMNGRQAGLHVLCTHLRASSATVENLERLLLRRGYIRYENAGRKLTPTGMAKVRNT